MVKAHFMSQFLDVFQSIMQSGSNLADLSNIHNLIAIFYYLLETQKTEKNEGKDGVTFWVLASNLILE